MSNRLPMSERFKRVKASFKDGARWVRGRYGNYAGQHCLVAGIDGSLTRLQGSNRSQEKRRMEKLVRKVIGKAGALEEWNDRQSRTWKEVDAVLGACIELAEREEKEPEVIELPSRAESREKIHA